MSTEETPATPSARSFGQAADLYDAARPSYPAEALAWMLGAAPLDVADVGAGTGLLTRGLIAAGHRVTAVEPDPGMLGKLVETTPGLVAGRRAAAEDLPLPDGAVDAVTAGQSFHWFDRERALPEIRRVLRDDGVLALIWNVRDESVPWVRALTDVIGSSAGEIAAAGPTGPGHFGPHFAEPEIRNFRHEKHFDGPGLLRLVQSRSHYLTADERRRRELLAGVDDLIANHPQLAGRKTFAMPYQTRAFRIRPA